MAVNFSILSLSTVFQFLYFQASPHEILRHRREQTVVFGSSLQRRFCRSTYCPFEVQTGDIFSHILRIERHVFRVPIKPDEKKCLYRVLCKLNVTVRTLPRLVGFADDFMHLVTGNDPSGVSGELSGVSSSNAPGDAPGKTSENISGDSGAGSPDPDLDMEDSLLQIDPMVVGGSAPVENSDVVPTREDVSSQSTATPSVSSSLPRPFTRLEGSARRRRFEIQTGESHGTVRPVIGSPILPPIETVLLNNEGCDSGVTSECNDGGADME